MVPRPRRLNCDRPLAPVLVLPSLTEVPVLPDKDGSWVMASNTLGLACWAISAELTTVVGVGALKPLAVIREEETTTVSILLSLVCAWAEEASKVAMARLLLLPRTASFRTRA